MARGYFRIGETKCFDCGAGGFGEPIDLRKFDLPPMCQPCAEKRGHKWEEGKYASQAAAKRVTKRLPEEGEEVDYTTQRARGRIRVCPKCGRNGHATVANFKGEGRQKLIVTHKKTFMGFYWRVTDSCIVAPPTDTPT